MFTSNLGLGSSFNLQSKPRNNKTDTPTDIYKDIKVRDLKMSSNLDHNDNITFKFRVIGFSENISAHTAESIQFGAYDQSSDNNIQPSLKTFITHDKNMHEMIPVMLMGGRGCIKDAKSHYNDWLVGLQQEGKLTKETRVSNYIRTRSKILTVIYVEDDPEKPENNGKIFKYFMPVSVWDKAFVGKNGKRNIEKQQSKESATLVRKIEDMEYRIAEARKARTLGRLMTDDFKREMAELQEEYNKIEFNIMDLSKGAVLNLVVSPRGETANTYSQSFTDIGHHISEDKQKEILDGRFSLKDTLDSLLENYGNGVEKDGKMVVEKLETLIEKGYSREDALYEISVQRAKHSIETRLKGKCALFEEWNGSRKSNLKTVVENESVTVGNSSVGNVSVTLETNDAQPAIPSVQDTIAKVREDQNNASVQNEYDDEIPF